MSYVDNNMTVLVVGNIGLLFATMPELPLSSGALFCVIDDLTPAFLERHNPQIIISPIVTSQYDVMELAVRLDQLNFEGQFRALSAPLPNPEIIISEIRFECPALDFDLIVVQPGQGLYSI